ncbi:MAG: hypothetical protein ACOYVF_05260 [Candidatus Zixiibacteriota bacterium]
MSENIDHILSEYLDTCNEVLNRYEKDKGADDTDTAGKILNGQIIKLVIYEDDLDDPCCFTHIIYRSGCFEKIPLSAGQPHIIWTLSRQNLEAIVRNRREISEQSKKLGWGCLVSRLGIKCGDEPLTDCELP